MHFKLSTPLIYLAFTSIILLQSCKKSKDDVTPKGEITLTRDNIIIDAEYHKKRDLLVYATTNPSQLNLLYTESNKKETIDLGYLPMSVSISPDGNFAVVGHDGHLSHIDLDKRKVMNTFDVSCESLDIVYGSNTAFVFPKRDQWSTIRRIDLSTGKETLSAYASIYAGSKGKLHPSGKSLYVTDNNLGPSDIHKFEIQTEIPKKLYDSPYHGDYEIGGDLWFSEDGNRVFVRGQTVLKLSDNQQTDLTYNGSIGLDTLKNTIAGYRKIMSLDHSAASNKLYVISSDTTYKQRPNLPYIMVYNATNLDYLKLLPLKANVPANQQKLEPHFVFVNSKGTRLFVVTKELTSSTSAQWSIQVM